MVGTVSWVGRKSEWSHYTAITSHSFSLPSNQVSSNNKSNTTITLLCHPPVVTRCSRFLVKRENTSSQSCCITGQSLGGVWCSQWGCSWTMKSQDGVVGGVSLFKSSKSWVWKEVRLFFAERIRLKWLIWSQNSESRALVQVGCSWIFHKQEKRENQWSLLGPQILQHSYVKGWEANWDQTGVNRMIHT